MLFSALDVGKIATGKTARVGREYSAFPDELNKG
jgi:hypothetical protein